MTPKPFYTEMVRQSLEAADYERAIQMQYDQAFSDAQSSDKTIAEAGKRRLDELSEENARRYAAASRGVAGVANPAAEAYLASYAQAARPRAVAGVIAPGIVPGAAGDEEVKEQEQGIVGLVPPTALARRNSLGSQRDANSRRQAFQQFIAMNSGRNVMFGQARAREEALRAAAAAAGAPAAALPADAGDANDADIDAKDDEEEKDPFLAVEQANRLNALNRIAAYYDANPKPRPEAVPTGIYKETPAVPVAPDIGPALNAATAESIRLAATPKPDPKVASKLHAKLTAYQRQVAREIAPEYKRVSKDARADGYSVKQAARMGNEAKLALRQQKFPDYLQKVAELESAIFAASVANAPLSSTNAPYPVIDQASQRLLEQNSALEQMDKDASNEIGRLKELAARQRTVKQGKSPAEVVVKGLQAKRQHEQTRDYLASYGPRHQNIPVKGFAIAEKARVRTEAIDDGIDPATAEKMGEQARLAYLKTVREARKHPKPGPREGVYEDELKDQLDAGETFEDAADAASDIVGQRVDQIDRYDRARLDDYRDNIRDELTSLVARRDNLLAAWTQAGPSNERTGVLMDLARLESKINTANARMTKLDTKAVPTTKEGSQLRQKTFNIKKILDTIPAPPVQQAPPKSKKGKKKGKPPSAPGPPQQPSAPPSAPSASAGPQGAPATGSAPSAPLLPTGSLSVAPVDPSQSQPQVQASQSPSQSSQSQSQSSPSQASQTPPQQQSPRRSPSSQSEGSQPSPSQGTQSTPPQPPPPRKLSTSLSTPPLSAIKPSPSRSRSSSGTSTSSVSSNKPPEAGSAPTLNQQPPDASLDPAGSDDDEEGDESEGSEEEEEEEEEEDRSKASVDPDYEVDDGLQRVLDVIDGEFAHTVSSYDDIGKFTRPEITRARRAAGAGFDLGVKKAHSRGYRDLNDICQSGLSRAREFLESELNENFAADVSKSEKISMMDHIYKTLKEIVIQRLRHIYRQPTLVPQEYRDYITNPKRLSFSDANNSTVRDSKGTDSKSTARIFGEQAGSDSDRDDPHADARARPAAASTTTKRSSPTSVRDDNEPEPPPLSNAVQISEASLSVPDTRPAAWTPSVWRKDDAGAWGLLRQIYKSMPVPGTAAQSLLDDDNHNRRTKKPTQDDRRDAESAVLVALKHELPTFHDSNGRLVTTLPSIHALLEENASTGIALLKGEVYLDPHASRLLNFTEFLTAGLRELATQPASGASRIPVRREEEEEVKDGALPTADEAGEGEQVPIGARGEVHAPKNKRLKEAARLEKSADARGLLVKGKRVASKHAIIPGQEVASSTGRPKQVVTGKKRKGDSAGKRPGDLGLGKKRWGYGMTGQGDEPVTMPEGETMGPPPPKKPTLPSKDVLAVLGTQELPIYDRTENKASDIQNSNMFTMRAYYPNQQNYGTLTPKHKVALGAVSDPDTRFNAKRKVRPPLGWVSVDDGPASKMARRF
jgi:hypothetical protein